jgi:aspartyl aminopeptidase
MDENAVKNAKQFLGFLNKSPTPYHVVDNVRNLLRSDGFKELRLQDKWIIVPGKYFVTKNDSTLVAFAIGDRYAPGNPFSIVAAHTGCKNFF